MKKEQRHAYALAPFLPRLLPPIDQIRRDGGLLGDISSVEAKSPLGRS
jgi:hypothetical protein